MLKAANHILHIAVFGMVCIFGDYDTLTTMIIVVSLMVSWGISRIGLGLASGRRSMEVGALSIGIILLYWVGYVTKLGLGMLISDQYWVVPLLVSEDALLREMPNALALATLGYLSVMAAVLSFPLRAGLRWEIPYFRPRTKLISVLLPLSLVVKYLLKVRFDLGIPGVDPLYLGLPYLAGFLAFVFDTGFVFVSNILLFCGLALGRPKLMLYGLLLGFANAGIDLRFGSKDTAMYQLAIAGAYLVIARYSLVAPAADFRRTARIAIAALAVMGVGVIGAYRFFNDFRFAMQFGGGVSEVALSAAIDTAMSSDVALSGNSVMDIYNRITGLETLAALVSLGDKLRIEGGLAAMIDGSVVQRFTLYIMGTDEAKTMFSVTQFGYYYLSGGLAGLVLGCLFLGYGFCLIQFFVLRMKVHHAMKLAFLPVLWIVFIKSLLGGGNMILWLKEIVVLVATFYVAARLACPVRLPHGWLPSTNYHLFRSHGHGCALVLGRHVLVKPTNVQVGVGE